MVERVLFTESSVLSITLIALLAPAAVLISIGGAEVVVLVAVTVWLVNPVAAAAPPEAVMVIPVALVESK